MIETELARLHREHAAAQDADDKPKLAKINRDLRYWTSRRATAQVVEPPRDRSEVRFGSTVTIDTGNYTVSGVNDNGAFLRRADELGIDPAEVRRRNFLPPDSFPYANPSGLFKASGGAGLVYCFVAN